MGLSGLEACVPCVRPHYQVRDGQLYFLISRRPAMEIPDRDLDLFQNIDGIKTVGEITREDPGATERIRKWRDADILELIPPAVGVSGPHLVVIEPHMDDAALSVCGRLLHRRGKNRITILSAVKYSNFTSYWDLNRDFLDVEKVTSLRLRESGLAARLIGAEHRCLDGTDAPIRLYPAERWSVGELKRILPAVYAYMEIPPGPAEVAALKEALRKELESLSPDEIWIPMGLGTHLDHKTVRSACVAMLAEAEGDLAKASVCMYEDLPYSNASLSRQIRNSLESRGAALRPGTEDITNTFDEKLRVISVFASQFKMSYMEPLIRKCAARGDQAGEGRLEEVFYRVEGRLVMPSESEMAPNRKALEAGRRRVRGIASETGRYRHFVVLATPSANLGRWRTDCDRILAMVPGSVIRLVIPGEKSWEVSGHASGGIDVVVARKGISGWILEFLKSLIRPKTALVVLWWGAGREAGGWKVRALNAVSLLFGNTVIAQSLGDFCLLLDEERGIKR